MKELLLIPIITMTTYLIYVYIKYGMSKSISASYKFLKGIEKPIFSLVLWATAFPLIIVGLQNIPEGQVKILFFLSGALIALIGASPKYWIKSQEQIAHYVGSYGGIGLGMLALLIHFPTMITLGLVTLFALFTSSQFLTKVYRVNNFIYWVEVAAILTSISILSLN